MMERKVLDNGYVVLINMMGDDFTPALVAGISFNRHELRTPEQEERLIRHLLANILCLSTSYSHSKSKSRFSLLASG